MIGFIGGGNMAEALIKGMTGSGMRDVMVSEPREERGAHLAETYGVKVSGDNREVVSSSDIVILAVKPQHMAEVLDEVGDLMTGEKTVVSIAAGITLSYFEQRLETTKIIRVMPNVAAMAQEGMSVLSLCECFPDREMSVIREIFMASGRVLVLPEKYLDAVTALSGSGPAFIALFVDAMMEAAGELGLGEDEARELVLQTLAGTSALLAGGMPPGELVEMVRSPGGTTHAGLEVFESRGFRDMVGEALRAAARRSRELAI
jgi:pyrroline-5-carboxylate reductase